MLIPIGRNGLYGTIEADEATLPVHVNDFVFEYGLRQILNDAVSQKEDKDGNRLTNAEIFKRATAKWEQLVAGELRKRRESGEPTDPIEAEAFKLAKAVLEKAFRAKGLWPKNGEDKFQRAVDARMKSLKKPEMSMEDYIDRWLEANPKVLESAARIVAERNATPEDIL